jgi:hypothetical protein
VTVLVRTLVVRVFWRDREEPKERCAERLADCLTKLGEVAPLFTKWKRLGRSRSEARAEIEITPQALSRRLRQSYSDIPREPIPSLGYGFGAWAGDFDGADASIHVSCGAYGEWTSNRAVLQITCDGSWQNVRPKVVRELFDLMVRVWEAQSGTAGFGDPDTHEIRLGEEPL